MFDGIPPAQPPQYQPPQSLNPAVRPYGPLASGLVMPGLGAGFAQHQAGPMDPAILAAILRSGGASSDPFPAQSAALQATAAHQGLGPGGYGSALADETQARTGWGTGQSFDHAAAALALHKALMAYHGYRVGGRYLG